MKTKTRNTLLLTALAVLMLASPVVAQTGGNMDDGMNDTMDDGMMDESNDSPGFGALALVAVGAVAVLVRRRS